jgi:1A family penicillin-binding protein
VKRGAGIAPIVVAVALFPSSCTLGPVDLKHERPLALRSTITAADGTRLARLYKENRVPVRLDRLPKITVKSVLAAEDANFFTHPGYDLKAIARAAITNLREGEIVQGGSTITQQYVKNVYFRDPPKSFRRKARELRLAIEIEKLYSKREILERYLNTVYFGQGAYGIKAAAETYFGHGVGSLSLAESALIAGLIKAPSNYDPRRHPQMALARRSYVIDRLVELGDVSEKIGSAADSRSLGLSPTKPISTKEPYFVEAVRQELLSDRRLGNSESDRDRTLYEGGLRVETTINLRMQALAEKAVADVLNQPGDPEAAVVAIRPETGEILAMVGGRKWSESQVNLALGTEGGGSGRQPGSSFKTIVAAAALEAGIPLSTRFDSAPAVFDLGDGQTWPVGNSEGGDYGLMTLEEGLIRSVNGVYARLALEIGVGQIVSMARLMGITSHLPAYPSMALGASEVSVLDMATAYATLANGGTRIEPTTIRSIDTAEGEKFGPDQEVIEGALSPGNVYLLTRALEQVIQRGTGYQAQIGRPAAGKTGTTDDYADAWFVGYTPQLVTAVWVGYPDGRVPMTSVHGIRVMGGTFPALIWREFMSSALEDAPIKEFQLPEGELVTVEIDPDTGLLAAPWCPGKPKTMLRQLAPTETCPVPPPSPEPAPSPDKGPTDVKASPSPSDSKDSKPDEVKGDVKPDDEQTPKDGGKPTSEGNDKSSGAKKG